MAYMRYSRMEDFEYHIGLSIIHFLEEDEDMAEQQIGMNYSTLDTKKTKESVKRIITEVWSYTREKIEEYIKSLNESIQDLDRCISLAKDTFRTRGLDESIKRLDESMSFAQNTLDKDAWNKTKNGLNEYMESPARNALNMDAWNRTKEKLGNYMKKLEESKKRLDKYMAFAQGILDRDFDRPGSPEDDTGKLANALLDLHHKVSRLEASLANSKFTHVL